MYAFKWLLGDGDYEQKEESGRKVKDEIAQGGPIKEN